VKCKKGGRATRGLDRIGARVRPGGQSGWGRRGALPGATALRSLTAAALGWTGALEVSYLEASDAEHGVRKQVARPRPGWWW